MQLSLILTLVVLASVQAVTIQSNHLCFFGGEFVVSDISTEVAWQCAFGTIRVPSTVQDGTVLCRYPALKDKQYRVSVYSGSQKHDLGFFSVQSCVKVSDSQGCPADKPEVIVELPNDLVAQNEFACLWNGVGWEASPKDRKITCTVPYNGFTERWDLTLQTRDRRGYISLSEILTTFRYQKCEEQVPEILSTPEYVTPWVQQIPVVTSMDATFARKSSVQILCRFTSKQSVHIEAGSSQDGNVICPATVLPIGVSTLDLSLDGKTFSNPTTITTVPGIKSVSTLKGCAKDTVTLKSDTLFPTWDYTCYFGSETSKATLSSDSKSLTCKIPYGHDTVDLALLIHDRAMNRATSYVVDKFTYDKC